MKFSFKETFLLSMKVDRYSHEDVFEEKRILFKSENSSKGKEYYIDFMLKLKISEGYLIDVIFRSVFLFSNAINNSIMDNKKLEIMCCTIGYPYFRAYITNFTVMSGFKPVILDNINFFSLYEKEFPNREET